MKRIISLTAVFAATLAFTAAPVLACGGSAACGAKGATTASAKYTCGSSTTGATAASYANCGDNCKLASGQYSVAMMKVDGLTCGGCEAKLTGEFMKSEGVLWVASVSAVDGTAKIIYDKSLSSDRDLLKAVSSAGFSGKVVPAIATSDVGSTSKFSNNKLGKRTCGFSGNAAACSAAKKKMAVTNSSGVRIASASKVSSKAGRGCCAAGAGLAKRSGTNTSFASSNGVSSGKGFCDGLTAAEHAAFCAQFCSNKSNDTKKSL